MGHTQEACQHLDKIIKLLNKRNKIDSKEVFNSINHQISSISLTTLKKGRS